MIRRDLNDNFKRFPMEKKMIELPHKVKIIKILIK